MRKRPKVTPPHGLRAMPSLKVPRTGARRRLHRTPSAWPPGHALIEGGSIDVSGSVDVEYSAWPPGHALIEGAASRLSASTSSMTPHGLRAMPSLKESKQALGKLTLTEGAPHGLRAMPSLKAGMREGHGVRSRTPHGLRAMPSLKAVERDQRVCCGERSAWPPGHALIEGPQVPGWRLANHQPPHGLRAMPSLKARRTRPHGPAHPPPHGLRAMPSLKGRRSCGTAEQFGVGSAWPPGHALIEGRSRGFRPLPFPNSAWPPGHALIEG